MSADAKKLEAEILAAIEAAEDAAALEAVRVGALGKKGSVSALLKTLGGMSPEERQLNGPLFNVLRDTIAAAIADKKTMLEAAALNARLAEETLDMTLPVEADPQFEGRIHPVAQVMEEIAAIFADMGFDVAEGPDIESQFYNFTALNIPEAHPARQMHDTFLYAGRRRRRAACLAHPYFAGASAHHDERAGRCGRAAFPLYRAGPHVSLR